MNKRCCFPPKAPRGGAGGGGRTTTWRLAGAGPAAQGRAGHRDPARHLAKGKKPLPAPQPTSKVPHPLPGQVEPSPPRERAMGKNPTALHLAYGKGTLAPRLPGRCMNPYLVFDPFSLPPFLGMFWGFSSFSKQI